MPWPLPEVDLPIEVLTPGARTALYAILVSTRGDIGPCPSRSYEVPNLQVSRSQWLETELRNLDEQCVQLLAFYTMLYGGNVLPETHDAQVSATVTVSPYLAHVFSQCQCQKNVLMNVMSYYKSDNSTIIEVASGSLVESAQFIQQSFMDLANRIPHPKGNTIVKSISMKLLHQLPQNPEPTTEAILDCLQKCIQKGLYIPDTERFVRERWVSEHTDMIRRKVAHAYHSFDVAGGP
ncbi:hypothetical protein BDV09DRAFT_195219 [Aspergillus tetrazonus]